MFHYLFGLQPQNKFLLVYLAFFLILFGVAIYLKKYSRKQKQMRLLKKFWQEFGNGLVSFSFGGLVLTFLRYEQIRHLSMRFILFLYLLLLFIFIAFKLFIKLPRIKKQEERFVISQKHKTYLPQAKQHKHKRKHK